MEKDISLSLILYQDILKFLELLFYVTKDTKFALAVHGDF